MSRIKEHRHDKNQERENNDGSFHFFLLSGWFGFSWLALVARTTCKNYINTKKSKQRGRSRRHG